MNKAVLLLSAFLLGVLPLAGCSVPRLSPPALSPEAAALIEDSGNLYSLRISRRGQQKFSGILGLRTGGDKLHFAMLDATGILLLEAEVEADGSFRVIRAVGQIADSRLPGYLAETLHNIFYVRPRQLPCSSSGLMELCREQSVAGFVKHLSFGPFTLWNLQMQEKMGEAGEIYRYSQSWLGIIIEFQRLDN